MLQFEESFFEDEVRDGFYVPSMIKKAWAAELTVMYEVDKICRKHNITYFTDWGTMLGAVRHGGFIPWDDDFDIMMRRKDYERFLQVAAKELPEGFAILNMENTENFWYFLSRIVLKPQICFEEEHLKQFHGFPYIVGIDIFILDTLSSDPQKEKERQKVIEYILAVADSLGTMKLHVKEKESALCRIEQICSVDLKHFLPDPEMKMQLYQLVKKLMMAFEGDRKGNYVQMIPLAVYLGNTGFPQDYFQDGVRVPFENIEIMLPVRYEEMLQKKYGNYMQLVRNRAGHDYPFFQSQKEQFEKVLGYPLPQYRYPGVCPKQNTEALSYKYRIREFIHRFDRLYEEICQGIRVQEALVEAQGNAIEMGNLIEQVRGGNDDIICKLEQYCEAVFELYNEAAGQNDAISTEKIRVLKHLGNSIAEDARRILKRKEAVFLPFSGRYWDALHSVWEALSTEADWDVYVVPLPYYYKEYDGSFHDMVYNVAEYPKEVPLSDYEKFDLALHHPDVIFIQNPYDEWNPATSIPKEYYSSEIRNYTEQLVYIPYFEVEGFDKECEREYWNMNYYCTVPGVVNADVVFVQSEEMKTVYVDKLSEFAGDNTRDIWEKKIVGSGFPLMDRKGELTRRMPGYPQEWERIIRKHNGERKRLILFYVSMSALIQHNEKMIAKMERVLETAQRSKEEVVFVWKEDTMINPNEELVGKALFAEYHRLQEKILAGQGIILPGHMRDDLLVALCDGYYGVPSALGNKFQALHKPIMICSVEC